MLSARVAAGFTVLPALVVSCVLSPRAVAQQPAARPADQAAIDRAINAGVSYLRATQNPNGGWGTGTGPGGDKGWGVGYTALAGLALVECGVPPSDPGLKKAAAAIRFYVPELEQTYEVALAILFLDHMGDKKDRRVIQQLAGRLIAGQAATGGWGYKVPKFSAADADQLLNALRRMNPPAPPVAPSPRDRPLSMGLCIKTSDDILPRPVPKFDPEKAKAAALASLPANMKRRAVFLDPGELAASDPKDAGTDNSNTHFAMLAIWAARKHDVPVERSLTLLARRFRTSQGADGTWGYTYGRAAGGGSRPLTCVALLGLAIGHVVDPEPGVKPEQDPQVIKAFVWLSKQIQPPAGTIVGRPSPMDAGGLYYLWAMERIAVLYDVRSLDNKDWYQWGAEILLGHQASHGGWEKAGQHVEHPALSTALALLFLKRANLTPDLSRRLVVDPAALTQKVSDTVTPKPPPVTPTPKPPETETTAVAPMPHEVVASQAEPPPPTASEPQPSPAPATTTAPEKSSKWPWILLLVVLVAVFGVCAFMVVKKRRAASEEEVPRKKKKKPKAKSDA